MKTYIEIQKIIERIFGERLRTPPLQSNSEFSKLSPPISQVIDRNDCSSRMTIRIRERLPDHCGKNVMDAKRLRNIGSRIIDDHRRLFSLETRCARRARQLQLLE